VTYFPRVQLTKLEPLLITIWPRGVYRFLYEQFNAKCGFNIAFEKSTLMALFGNSLSI